MKRRDWFWCGALLFALMVFVSLQGIQKPAYAGIAGGLCALASSLLFGCGIRAGAQERSAVESEHAKEKQQQMEIRRQAHADDIEKVKVLFDELKEEVRFAREAVEAGYQAQGKDNAALLAYLRERFSAQEKSYAAALEQIRENIAAVTEKIQSLQKTVSSESRSYSAMVAQLSTNVETSFELNRTQFKENSQEFLNSIHEQYAALKSVVERQESQAANYYKFMVGQPWNVISVLYEVTQTMADQLDSMLTAVDSMQIGTEKQVKTVLKQVREDSELLHDRLQAVCKMLETQGQESRDALDRVMQGYSDVTAQDIEVLTALAKGVNV